MIVYIVAIHGYIMSMYGHIECRLKYISASVRDAHAPHAFKSVHSQHGKPSSQQPNQSVNPRKHGQGVAEPKSIPHRLQFLGVYTGRNVDSGYGQDV